jgi:hypothetical protein
LAKVIEYDVSDVEESSGGTGVKVPPGVKIARIAQCEQREKKADGTPANDIKVALDFGSEYDWGFTYIGLSEAADWKLAEFVRALGLKEKGKLDPSKQVDKFIRVKVNPGTHEGEYSPNMGRLMKAQPGDEEAWREGNSTASELSSKPAGPDADGDGDEPVAEAGVKTYSDPDFVPSREGEPGISSYEEWPDEDLIAEVGDRDLALAGGRGSKRNKAIEALRAEDAEIAEGGGDGEPEKPGAAPEPEDDYDTWDLDQLKADWEARQLGDLPAMRGSGAAERLKAAIIEELRKDDLENPFTP